MRYRYDMQLHTLDTQLTHMGELCEAAITKVTQALKDGNTEQAQVVIKEDEEIDQIEKDIERLCLKLLLQQQPVARDLRRISAALKMITDMERIGDQTSDIAGGRKKFDLTLFLSVLVSCIDNKHAFSIVRIRTVYVVNILLASSRMYYSYRQCSPENVRSRNKSTRF